MGHEDKERKKLCNAVIIAKPGVRFIAEWLAEYDNFDKKKPWEFYGCIRPKEISYNHPHTVASLTLRTLFWPLGATNHLLYVHGCLRADEVSGLEKTMHKYHGSLYEEQVLYHGWNHLLPDLFKALTPEIIRRVDTRFNILFRGVLDTPLT